MPNTKLIVMIALSLLFSVAYAEDSPSDGEQVAQKPVEQAAPTRAEQLRTEAIEINDRIQKIGEDLQVLNDSIDHAAGDRLEVLILERQKTTLEILDELFALARNLEKQSSLDLDTAELRDMVVSYLVRTSNALDQFLDREEDEMVERRSRVIKLTGIELVEFEQNNASTMTWFQEMIEAKLRSIQELEELGVSTGNHRENLVNRLNRFASSLAGQLQLVDSSLKAIKVGSGSEPLSSDLKAQLQALNIRRSSILSSLALLVHKMNALGLEAKEYRQLLLETGEVTTDLFDPEIVLGIVQKQLNIVSDWLSRNAGVFLTKLVVFVLIITAFRLIARATNFMMRRSFESQTVQVSKLMQDMLLGLSSKGIMFLGVLVALSHMGVEITALLTGLGIAGFIVGFALQDSLANFVAGIMILGYRPFDVGDVIEAGGVFGKVSKMSMVSTTILTFDNQTLIVPNNKIWGDVIKNITLQHERRIDLEFNVGLNENIGDVRYLIHGVLESIEEILEDPAPSIEFNELTPYSMVIVVRPWVQKEVYWPTRWRLLREIKQALDDAGVEIPRLDKGVVIQQ
ncbi:MAG: mechanosensitive ion channel [Pseudomonadales bacterium]|nr:mechanosensitive ion channel [Pseudomonadales bacterium]MBO6703515.1 mechanosensitive ion channel [Pseudomonadales bacterium]MBO7004621.1 mechanosensitive ion channel [Pseudomonadales bacterium]